MEVKGCQEKIWKTCLKVWKIHILSLRKSGKVLVSIEDILKVFNRGCEVSRRSGSLPENLEGRLEKILKFPDNLYGFHIVRKSKMMRYLCQILYVFCNMIKQIILL
jgi:hypothetical protein